jgi:hypothetical protein
MENVSLNCNLVNQNLVSIRDISKDEYNELSAQKLNKMISYGFHMNSKIWDKQEWDFVIEWNKEIQLFKVYLNRQFFGQWPTIEAVEAALIIAK